MRKRPLRDRWSDEELDPANVKAKLPAGDLGEGRGGGSEAPEDDPEPAWPIRLEPGNDFLMSADALIRTYREAQAAEAKRAYRIERRGD